jgi:hypothetical protein
LETAQKNSDNEQSCGSYSAYSSSNESKYLKRQKQESLDFGTGAAPQREGRQVATEATEDQQQEEELKAGDNTIPPPKPTATADSKDSVLGKRSNSNELERELLSEDEQNLFGVS